jgi:hypothetical protein
MWIKRLFFAVLTVFVLAGCEPEADDDDEEETPPAAVSLSEAKDSYNFLVSFALAVGSYCTEDNGSTGDVTHIKNPENTLFADQSPASGAYPLTIDIHGESFMEPTTGYTFSGDLDRAYTDSTHGTWTFDVQLVRDDNPTETVTGTLTLNGTNATGSLTFNADIYTYAELTGE